VANVKGIISDATTGERMAAKVHVLTSNGRFVSPPEAVLKVGPDVPFFYCDGEFEVKAPTGGVRVLVERGTEYVPLQRVARGARLQPRARQFPARAIRQ
jgi:hypothetical protein